MEVEAIKSFDHGGARKRGDRFEVSPQHAEALRKRGLVVLVGASVENPSTAAGETSSASPAAQALPKTTAKPSGRGGRRRKDAASS